MKRDLQINYGVLDEIIDQLRKYENNLETMEESLTDVSTYIQTYKGESIDAWDERITGSKGKIKDYQAQVGDLLSLFENYVADTTAYISPNARNAMMRVDRNDIWFNLKQMDSGIANNVPKAVMKTYDSPTSIFNLLDDPTDAEKEASRINQAKIEEIRQDIRQTKTNLEYKMDELWDLYTSKVKRFENVDDEYNDKAANIKAKYTNFFEGVWDVVEWGTEKIWSLVKGLAVGLYEIAKGLLTLVLDAGIVVLSAIIPDIIEPELLKQAADDRVDAYEQTLKHIISDPMSVVESIGQSVFDAAEDEGIMYVAGYGLTSFVPVVGQAGRGAKGVTALKGINKGSNKNVPTGISKGIPYSKDYVKQKMETANTALGKTKVPVFYREKLATNSANINTFGMEMKPLSDLSPQMFSVKGSKGNTSKIVNKDNLNNIDKFINGTKKFDDVIDDYVKLYSEKVISNKTWSWNKSLYGGANLTARQKRMIKEKAVEDCLVPDVKVIKADGVRYGFADFKSAGLVEETRQIPERLWLLSDQEQFKWLDNAIGGRPEGMTWHHTEVPGKMELVPFGIHNITIHNGGRSAGMWASAPR